MNPAEYARLAQAERDHWFYRGKRDIVRYWLRRLGAITPASTLVDVGAGSGLFAAEMSRLCRTLAVDDHEEALELARRQLGPENVRRGSCTALPLDDASADCVTALDVLEHVEDDRGALREAARVLRPGGTLVVTVPALQILWSDWDASLHHLRRYNRRQLLSLVHSAPFDVVYANYINVAAFPVVLATRKLRTVFRARRADALRFEDITPRSSINALLRLVFVIPAYQSVIRFPFGVGLLAVARRR